MKFAQLRLTLMTLVSMTWFAAVVAPNEALQLVTLASLVMVILGNYRNRNSSGSYFKEPLGTLLILTLILLVPLAGLELLFAPSLDLLLMALIGISLVILGSYRFTSRSFKEALALLCADFDYWLCYPFLLLQETWEGQLGHAASQGDLEAVNKLLRWGAKTSGIDRNGQGPLHLAAKHGHFEVVKALLAAGANPVAVDQEGRQPIHEAARQGHLDIVQALIAAGCSPTAATKRGNQVIHEAISGGHLQILKFLLAAGVDPEARDDQGWQPIHLAASKDIEMVKLLLAAGAKADSRALHQATRDDLAASMELLLAAGADANAPNEWGPPILEAARMGSEKVVRVLLASGAKTDVIDRDGLDLIHQAAWACQGNVAALIEMFLASGVPVNAPDHAGRLALHKAAENGYAEAVKVLLKNGCPVDARGPQGQQPIHAAAGCGSGEWIGYHNGFWRFIAAIRGERNSITPSEHSLPHEETLKILLAAGAQVKAQDHKGRQALHEAAARGSPSMVSLLLAAGADVHAKDQDGRQPIHEAANRACGTEVVQILFQSGAELKARLPNGRSPLSLALESDFVTARDILKLRCRKAPKSSIK